MAAKTEWIKQHSRQIEVKNGVIQQHILTIEDLALTTRNQKVELDSKQYQLDKLKIDLDESLDKIHQINRARHDLELQLEAEKMLN